MQDRKASSITIEVVDGIVVVDHHGVIHQQDTEDTLSRVREIAAAAQTHRLLLDFSDASMPDYHAITVSHGDHALDSGLARYRIALVGRDGDPMVTFMETVGINRGVAARAFSSRTAAMPWLKG